MVSSLPRWNTSQMPIRRTGSIKCPLGDSFSASGEHVETVTVVDCEQAHIYEVFAIFDHEVGADQPYPGDDELLRYADTSRSSTDYVAIDYRSSIYWSTPGGPRSRGCSASLRPRNGSCPVTSVTLIGR